MMSESINSLLNETKHLFQKGEYYGENIIENKYVYTSLILLLILYGSLVAPNLPVNVTTPLNNWWVKMIVFFIVAYLVSKDKMVALVITIAAVLTFQQITKNNIIGQLFEGLDVTPIPNSESVQDNDVPIATNYKNYPPACNILNDDQKVEGFHIGRPGESFDQGSDQQIATNKKGNPLKHKGKYVVGNPTPLLDASGNPVLDSTGQPVMTAPKSAENADTGADATTANGNSILAPVTVLKDKKGNIMKDKNGNYKVQHTKVKIDAAGNVYQVNLPTPNGGNKDYWATEDNTGYERDHDVMKRNLTSLCDNNSCIAGSNSEGGHDMRHLDFNPEDTKTELCDVNGDCYSGYAVHDLANF